MSRQFDSKLETPPTSYIPPFKKKMSPAELLISSHPALNVTREEVRSFTEILDQGLLDWMQEKKIKFNSGVIHVIVDGELEEMETDQDYFGRFLEEIPTTSRPEELPESSYPVVTREEVQQFASRLDKSFLDWMREKHIRFNSGDEEIIQVLVEGRLLRMRTGQNDFGTFMMEEEAK